VGALVLRPASFLRLHGGGGTNSASAGYRGGVSVLPFGAGPSLSAEIGHYGPGETNSLVRTFVGAPGRAAALFRRMSYTYVNAHAGLDFGTRHGTFFLHGGLSMVSARLYDVGDALQDAKPSEDNPIRVSVSGDPTVRALIPSVKVGLVLYLP
jgi:hypothetical protein